MERTPAVYEAFRREQPALTAAFERQLGIAMGPARPAACAPRSARHSIRASRAEIEHAILLSITTVSWPAMITALGWSREVPDDGNDQAG